MSVEKTLNILGCTVEVLVSSHTSKGALGAIIQICEPGDGPPPHSHTDEDEFFYPVEGNFEMFNGETWAPLLSTGFYAPRYGVHTFRNCGSKTGRIMAVVTPWHNLQTYFERIEPLSLPQDTERLIAISAIHGIRFLMPELCETELEVERELAFA